MTNLFLNASIFCHKTPEIHHGEAKSAEKDKSKVLEPWRMQIARR
jgi:hypothetical protein